jgi:hypothetical protein
LHGFVRLVCGCSAMETHFMKLLTNSYCADVASRGSAATKDRRFLRALSLACPFLWACEVYHWAVAVPRRFHFTITAPTVDRGRSSSADIWKRGILWLLRWMSLSSSVKPFYCRC